MIGPRAGSQHGSPSAAPSTGAATGARATGAASEGSGAGAGTDAGGRKTAAWWDGFWQRPPAARGRDLTRRRTAEVARALLEVDGAAGTVRVLDLGCGNGDLTALLLAQPRLSLVGLDLSRSALGQFRAGYPAGLPPRLALVRASVYELPFPDGAFDAVVSFGYASAASYVGAEREVARVLRRGGAAIVDFANPSLYHWLASPGPTLRWYRRYRAPGEAQYHFGWRGLREHFGRAGLRLDALRYLNAYPPLDALAGRPWSGPLDRALSALAGPLLGRVLIARFRR